MVQLELKAPEGSSGAEPLRAIRQKGDILGKGNRLSYGKVELVWTVLGLAREERRKKRWLEG